MRGASAAAAQTLHAFLGRRVVKTGIARREDHRLAQRQIGPEIDEIRPCARLGIRQAQLQFVGEANPRTDVRQVVGMVPLGGARRGSEARWVGKGGVSPFRSWWALYYYKK